MVNFLPMVLIAKPAKGLPKAAPTLAIDDAHPFWLSVKFKPSLPARRIGPAGDEYPKTVPIAMAPKVAEMTVTLKYKQ